MKTSTWPNSCAANSKRTSPAVLRWLTPDVRLLLALLCLISAPLLSQHSKLVKLYDKGEYEKCLRLADKLIEKDRREGSNYVYKAMSYARLSQDSTKQDKYRYGVKSAVRTLKMLSRVDKEGRTLTRFPSEIALVQRIGHARGRYLEEDGDCERAIRLYDDLIEATSDNTALYLKGRCLIFLGDRHTGMFAVNQAVKNVYLDWKDGLTEPYLLDGFQELAINLIKEGFTEEAFITLNRAYELFPGDSLLLTYRDQLIEQATKSISIYTSDSTLLENLRILERNIEMFGSTEKAIEDKWYVIRTYLTRQKLIRDYESIHGFLDQFIRIERGTGDIDFAKAHDYLVTELLGEILVNEVRYDEQIIQFWSDLIIYIEQLREPGRSALDLMYESIDRQIELGSVDKTGCLLVAYRDDMADAGALAAYEKKFTDLLLSKYEGYNLNEEERFALDRWKSYFPENKTLQGFQYSLYIQLVEESLNAGDYSKTARFVRSALKLFPDDERIRSLYKRWIAEDYRKNFIGSNASRSELQWNGSAEQCLEGTITNGIHRKVQQRLNYLRRLAGIPDSCWLDEELNGYCQRAAMLMTANNSLSHMPPENWKCWDQKGYDGARNSNLTLGLSGPAALFSQLEDAGSNNAAVGHRRWILFPFRETYGHGSTNNAMSLWTLANKSQNYPKEQTERYKDRFVAWPPEGYIPEQMIFERWSFSYYGASFKDATVELTHRGYKVRVELEEVIDGYGLNTLVFKPRGLRLNGDEERVHVRIGNVKLLGKDEPVEFEYEVIALSSKLLD